MIIGISGKKQHGKDFSVKILKWIFASKSDRYHNEEIPMLFDYVHDKVAIPSDWKVVKFADKLKDIICLLTGCTRADLEDEDFKNSFMPIQWNKRVRGSYSSNFGKMVQDESSYNHNPKFYKIEYDVEDEKEVDRRRKDATLFFTDRIDRFDATDYRDRKYCIQVRRTYRDALQEIGTDLFRNQFNPNTWVDATIADYKPEFDDVYPNWFISDVRFPDEVKAIQSRGGIVIRINRPAVVSTDTHESEIALDDYQGFDAVIENDGDLFNLFHLLVEVVDSLIYKNGN